MTNGSGLDIFLTISLKYPELNAVRYLVDKHQIILEVALQGNIDYQKKTFTEKMRKHLSLLHKLSNKEPVLLELGFKEVAEITFLRFCRDVSSLTEEEIELFLSLLMQDFSGMIIKDPENLTCKDTLNTKTKRNLLKKMTTDNSVTDFFAYREQGKVFVFNK